MAVSFLFLAVSFAKMVLSLRAWYSFQSSGAGASAKAMASLVFFEVFIFSKDFFAGSFSEAFSSSEDFFEDSFPEAFSEFFLP